MILMILITDSLEKRNLEKRRGSLVVNDLLFYKKKRLLCWHLLTNECKPNSSYKSFSRRSLYSTSYG